MPKTSQTCFKDSTLRFIQCKENIMEPCLATCYFDFIPIWISFLSSPKRKKVGVKAGAQIKCLTQSLKSWECVVQQRLLPWLCQPRPQLVYRKLSFFKKSSGIQAFNLDAITKPTAPATTSGHTQPLVTASSSG